MSRFLYCLLPTALLFVAAVALAEDRSYDGTGNNLFHSTWGAANTDLIRIAPAAYDDGYASPRGSTDPTLPGARLISNTVVAQTTMMPNAHEMTDWVFQWGQFIDHDLDLTNPAAVPEEFDIPIPKGDSTFDPTSTGTAVMPFTRSEYDPATGTGPGNPRQQINEITSYIDGSQVYGSTAARADALRSHVGGKLLTSAGDLLPFNTMGLPNGTGGAPDPTQYYVAGDIRANEQIGLTSIQTLFMREHNRLADQVAAQNPTWTDEQVYQRARKLVGAEIQVITYKEFLPALLGSAAPGVNSVYNPNVNASVATEFSTALFRVGHTMLSPQLLRIQNDGTPAPGGPMSLRDAFFLPTNLSSGPHELDYLLKGLASDQQQEVDMHIVDDVRDFLVGEPGAGGFDLASLNIQRGRDHGLPDYNTMRAAYGLPKVTSFAQISSDPAIQVGLQSLYGDVNKIDPWVGALSEDHLEGSQIGPLITAGLVDQFTRDRDGDRFWYLRDADFSASDLDYLNNLSLSDVIKWNTSITNLQSNVFFMAVPEPSAATLLVLGAIVTGTLSKRRACA
ncbi:MAG TPA: peroxidase family protein [Lacipirellulaceae bacterium]|nr:peroxidase family protein [Lacipirellulaceae bacterium]